MAFGGIDPCYWLPPFHKCAKLLPSGTNPWHHCQIWRWNQACMISLASWLSVPHHKETSTPLVVVGMLSATPISRMTNNNKGQPLPQDPPIPRPYHTALGWGWLLFCLVCLWQDHQIETIPVHNLSSTACWCQSVLHLMLTVFGTQWSIRPGKKGKTHTTLKWTKCPGFNKLLTEKTICSLTNQCILFLNVGGSHPWLWLHIGRPLLVFPAAAAGGCIASPG